jgi:membrane-bound metal-dependent hydrolase YbcI (DUF457 family)
MMAKAHTLCGLIAGCGVAAVVPAAPLPVRLLAAAVTGGAALLPDLDHPSSTVARSLGILTRLLARALDAASLAIYHATRTGGDPADRKSGHRLVTHTVPGCILFASLTAASCLLHPASSAVALGMLGGLLGLGMRIAGIGVAASCAAAGWWSAQAHPGYWWLYGLAVLVGAFAHVAGDWCTNSGVPLAWPVVVGGRRWRLFTAPVTFDAGGVEERILVTPLLYGCLLLSGGAVTGVLPLLWHAAMGGV